MVTHFYTTVTATESILTLAQAKKQLRIENSFVIEDELIQSYIDAAQEACEQYLSRAIAERDLVLELDAFTTPIIFERNWENDTIEKIEYYKPGETSLTLLSDTEYKLRKSSVLECWEIKLSPAAEMPATDVRDDAVIITVKQGFLAEACPKLIVQAMNLKLSDFYERREDREQGNNPASSILLRPYRRY